MPARDFSKATFIFKKDMDIYLYFNSPGVEVWLMSFTFPFWAESERLFLSQDKSISGLDIHVSKSSYKIEKSKLCGNRTATEWSHCLKQAFTKEFQEKLPCKISYFQYLKLTKLRNCTKNDDHYKIFLEASKIVSDHWTKPEEEEICQKPCVETKYKTYITSVPKNTGLLNDTHLAQVLIYYDSLLVQENMEYFVYGGDRLVSAIGGVMGLCLGYSLLSIMLCLLDSLKIKIE